MLLDRIDTGKGIISIYYGGRKSRSSKGKLRRFLKEKWCPGKKGQAVFLWTVVEGLERNSSLAPETSAGTVAEYFSARH